jgi:uncharacterized protein with PIN domain
LTRVFLDTSCLTAIAFGEAGAAAIKRRIATFGLLTAAPLLEAEARAAFRRERCEPTDELDALLEPINWVIPDRPLSAEIATVLKAGYVKGADCWHLATALYLSPDPGEMTFLTLDARQGEVARALGFRR